MAKLDCADLNRTKLPRVISNRDGMFRTALLHIFPVDSAPFLHIFEDDLMQKTTKIPG